MKNRDITLTTYSKVREFFDKNPDIWFSKGYIGQQLKIDGYGITTAMNTLIKEKAIIEKKIGNRIKYALAKEVA